ncbi:glycosyltransferase [Demequina sp. NBRC 110055]|uniref:glycosyltransferase n=1 Tax=Demequina sp. NBRC 110055 TaxID=1570344 RepID=UPI0009FFAA53|nr:glycosyltransferase [Demequina sp. NBRC 110055]
MHVVEVVRSLDHGGVQRLLISRLRRVGHDHETWVVNTLPSEHDLEDALVAAGGHSVPSRGRGYVAGLRAVVSLVRRVDADVVVVHAPSDAVVMKVARALRLIRCPVVEFVHNTRYRSRIVAWAAAATNGFADAHFAVSASCLDAPHMRHTRHAHLMRQGIDVAEARRWVQAQSEEVARRRAEMGAGPGDVLAVFCGRLVAEKQPELVVEAAALVAGPRLKVALVGDGPEREHLERLAKSLGVADRVRVLGRREDGWTYVAAADVQCLPSLHEGLPVSLMESLAGATPVIATHIPGVDEIVEHGVNGVLLPAHAAASDIARVWEGLLADEELLARLRDGCAATAGQWDAAAADARFYTVLGELAR